MTDYWLVGFLGFCAGIVIGWLTNIDRPIPRRMHRRVHHTARPNPPHETKPVPQDAELSELRRMAGFAMTEVPIYPGASRLIKSW